jgi:twitching motility protein PilT
MEKLNEYLQTLLSTCSYELRLEPNKTPYIVSAHGSTDVANAPILGTQISMLVFPLIPAAVKQELPNKPEIEFVHNHTLGNFNFLVKKTSAGFNVTIRPLISDVVENHAPVLTLNAAPPVSNAMPTADFPVAPQNQSVPSVKLPDYSLSTPSIPPEIKIEPVIPEPASDFEDEVEVIPSIVAEPESINQRFENLASQAAQKLAAVNSAPVKPPSRFMPAEVNSPARNRMDKMFYEMADGGASDLHLSTSMPPMVRKDGKMKQLDCDEEIFTAETMKELLTSIMPPKNQEEFERRHDTDFAYQIEGLARFRANVFMDRKGMGGVFRVIPAKITTAEQLGLSKAILDLCNLSKGLVVVTGPTGSGKSTTLCAMVNYINYQREDHIITIEDPIEFTHENQKCLVNQREVHNHTDSFKDALRAALREDPDIILVGEMRDLETIAIAIETAETGHLVFGTLHTTTAASTVDRIIDQFPADRQQQIRVMLSESLKGVISQTLLPKKGGGRVAALEVLIVTPAISNLIREGKTFQIPSAMQTGKQHGMVMLNDALMDLVQKGIVEPRDAYIKAVEKNGFEALLARNGFKM